MSTPWFCPNVIPQRSRKGQGIKRPPIPSQSLELQVSCLATRNELREDFGTRFQRSVTLRSVDEIYIMGGAKVFCGCRTAVIGPQHHVAERVGVGSTAQICLLERREELRLVLRLIIIYFLAHAAGCLLRLQVPKSKMGKHASMNGRLRLPFLPSHLTPRHPLSSNKSVPGDNCLAFSASGPLN